LGVRCVSPADASREGPAIAFDQHAFLIVSLDARLATVTGIGANALILRPLFPMPLPGTPRALPKQPSADCQCQSTPCSSSHLVKQFVAFGQQEGPQNVEEGFVLPAHEGAVDAAVMTKLFRQLVPLAACSQAKDNAVEGLKIMPSKDLRASQRLRPIITALAAHHHSACGPCCWADHKRPAPSRLTPSINSQSGSGAFQIVGSDFSVSMACSMSGFMPLLSVAEPGNSTRYF